MKRGFFARLLKALGGNPQSSFGRPALPYFTGAVVRSGAGGFSSELWRFFRDTSKYRPHQGKREVARRRGQIERGMLKASA